MDTITIGLLIPFMGTLLGAATVFLLRDKMGSKFQKFLLGFASGVMIAASVWSLLIPAIEVSEGQSQYAWLPPAIGFLGGMGFLLLRLYHYFMQKKPRGKLVGFLETVGLNSLGIVFLHGYEKVIFPWYRLRELLPGHPVICTVLCFALRCAVIYGLLRLVQWLRRKLRKRSYLLRRLRILRRRLSASSGINSSL